MRKITIKRTVVNAFGSIGGLRLLSQFSKPGIVVLNYHRICPGHEYLNGYPFDGDVFSATVADFERQIVQLKRTVDIISVDDLASLVGSRGAVKRRTVVLTFDDAYADNYELVLPILSRYAIPACFFVPTSMIESRKLGWWDYASYYIKCARSTSFELQYPERVIFDLQRESVLSAYRRLLAVVKQRSELDYDQFLDGLRMASGAPEVDSSLASQQLMSWPQIREMQAEGMTIGAHSHSHEILAQLDYQSQLEDLRTCKDTLANQLGSAPEYLSYPVGGPAHYNQDTKKIVASLGFRLAFNFDPNWSLIDPATVDPFDVDRVGVHWDSPHTLVARSILA